MCLKKKRNIILVGLIPAAGPHEPSLRINTYPDRLVEELNILWKDGIQILSPHAHSPIILRAALLCVTCDKPAARKLWPLGKMWLLKVHKKF